MNYLIEPEVAGQLGEKTILDASSHPPLIRHLHFVFYGWLGDDLIECFPVFLITERLKKKLSESNLTGYYIKDCEIEVSEEFELLQPSTVLPVFRWLVVNGKEQDDFKIFNNRLCVSSVAYSILKQFNFRNAIVEPLEQ